VRTYPTLARSPLVAGVVGVSLLACHPQPSADPEPRPAQANVAWMPGQEREASELEQDDGSHDLLCAREPEAPGCPWARVDAGFSDEGVWGNRDPSTMPLPEPAPPERCPDSAVFGDLIEIPAGEFVMGCDDSDHALCGKAERRREIITLPAFAIDRTEVTQAAYQRCVEAKVCTVPAGGFRPTEACTHPVANVTWEQASKYCAWMDRRLPSEAEWEKAARGPDGRRFPWGDDPPTCAEANFGGCGLRGAVPVASHPSGASPYGVLDLAGNVREWVFDREEGRAKQPKRGIRGGMFTDPAMHLRAVRRTWGDVSVSDLGIGFRCAV
jgi:formylglycine-generating enzyme required for sulfatase activity